MKDTDFPNRAAGSPIVDQCVEGMIRINGWILHDIALSFTIMQCFDSKYKSHGEVGSEHTPSPIPTPGMHELVHHNSPAATAFIGFPW